MFISKCIKYINKNSRVRQCSCETLNCNLSNKIVFHSSLIPLKHKYFQLQILGPIHVSYLAQGLTKLLTWHRDSPINYIHNVNRVLGLREAAIDVGHINFKWAIPGVFFVYFRSFQTNINFTTN